MSERASESVRAVQEQARTMAQAIAEQATHIAMQSVDKLKDEGPRARKRFRVDEARHIVDEQVVANIRETALQAAATALDLWQSARDRAEDVIETTHHGIADPASNLFESVERRARDTSSAVAERADDVNERARVAARHAKETGVAASKDTGATLFWLATAGALVLYALIDSRLRNRVFGVAKGAATQGREIVRDIQGYDGDFGQTA